MQSCPSALHWVFHRFRGCFTAPGYEHFVQLMMGWILVRGTHTISRMLHALRRLGATFHHASVYRFLSQGRWSSDRVGRVVLELVRLWLPEAVVAIVDDTLCTKSGRQLFGVGIHHDVTRSTYGRQGRRIVVSSPGHSWVILAIHLPCPWDPQRGWAVPVLSRLYRSPGRCPSKEYRKRSELAAEMIGLLGAWLGSERRLYITGDAAYCCKTVIRSLPENVHLVGPIPLGAALYETAGRPTPRGRPRRKGYRIANPRTRLERHRGFETREVVLYAQPVQVQFTSLVCVWYPSASSHPVRVVITRDPRAPRDGRAYVSTDPSLSPEEVLALYALRWRLEVTFRDLKQELGFGDPRNGWWRRRHGERDNPCRPPHRPTVHPGRKAVERTAPLAGLAYAIILCWYLNYGNPTNDLACAQASNPWYRHKRHVSFNDMLTACRRKIGQEYFRRMRLPKRLHQIAENLLELGLVAA